MLYYLSDTLDPTYNIATEYYLFHQYKEPILYLWINGPSIVVGKHQNTIEEINTSYVNSHNIEVCRRMSGGGTVYHDEGNLNYTIISNDHQKKIDYETFSRPIIKALHKMGVNAETDSRNNITVDGYKICGHAQYMSRNRTMHHGCILFDSDLTVLRDALKVSKDKVKSKSIKSVRATVRNIKDFLTEDYTIKDFESYIKASVEEEYGQVESISLSSEDHTAIEALRQEKFTGWDWVYAKSPPFNLKRKRILPDGAFEVRLTIKNGAIKDIKFYGDYFGIDKVDGIEKKLTNVIYRRDRISSVVKGIDIESIFNVEKERFVSLLID